MHTDRIEQALQGLRPAAANATREFSYMTAAVLIALACVAVLLAILVPNAMFAGEARRAHETENGAARFEPKPRLAEQHRREVLEQRRERGEDATDQKGAANEKAAAKK